MKKFIIILIIVLTILISLYVTFFSIISVEKGRIGVIEDLRNSKVVKIFYNEKNFIWQGLIPWWYSTYELSLKRTLDFTVLIPIHPLENIKGDNYLVKIPVNFIYKIIPEKFYDISKLVKDEGDNEVNTIVRGFIVGLFTAELSPFLSPVYKDNLISENKEVYLNNTRIKLTDKLASIGIEIINLDITGNITYPNQATFNDGLLHLKELQKIAKNNEKEMKLLNNRLEKEKVLNKLKYRKYDEISKIIKDNPDILKYIYIDKLARNVKVLILPEKTGIPFNLGKVLDEQGNEKNNQTKDKNVDKKNEAGKNSNIKNDKDKDIDNLKYQ